MEFLVRYLALFRLFSVIDGFEWFCMGSIRKNIQLTLVFLKAPFWVLHFPFCMAITFLMKLSIILLSMLMMLLSTSSVIRHLICGNNNIWLLNLNMTCVTLWTGAGSDLLISVLEKLSLFLLTGLTTGAIDMKMDGSVVGGKSYFKMLGLSSCSQLN